MTVNWQVTATTLYCQAIAEEVTVMVYKDGSIKCTGCNKYASAAGEQALSKRSRQLKRDLACAGPEGPATTAYRDKLYAEEVRH
jgi:hypothetical protein